MNSIAASCLRSSQDSLFIYTPDALRAAKNPLYAPETSADNVLPITPAKGQEPSIHKALAGSHLFKLWSSQMAKTIDQLKAAQAALAKKIKAAQAAEKNQKLVSVAKALETLGLLSLSEPELIARLKRDLTPVAPAKQQADSEGAA